MKQKIVPTNENFYPFLVMKLRLATTDDAAALRMSRTLQIALSTLIPIHKMSRPAHGIAVFYFFYFYSR